MTEKSFMGKINSYPQWNSGLWAPWINDCHNDLNGAFTHAGVNYPGAPNGRLDIDDELRDAINSILGKMLDAMNFRDPLNNNRSGR
jgi:hypothetical protein